MEHVLFDIKRESKTGMSEAVFCPGKPLSTLISLAEAFNKESGKNILFTRLAPDVFSLFPKELQQKLDYDPLSQTAFAGSAQISAKGSVAIVSAGTCDAQAVWEAARTLQFYGISHTVFEDRGVAGLWRLLDSMEEINKHTVIIAAAGFDAALASVLGGLTSKPIIGIPTSAGYGAAEQGKTALNSMLTSCSSGIMVMNIDNGYGAACAAKRILSCLN